MRRLTARPVTIVLPLRLRMVLQRVSRARFHKLALLMMLYTRRLPASLAACP